MSKIVLDDTLSGYNLSKINANFQKIEDALNNKCCTGTTLRESLTPFRQI